MAFIQAVTTTLPEHRYTQDDVGKASLTAHDWDQAEQTLFKRFLAGSKISSRNFALPIEQILRLKGAEQRSKVFYEQGQQLAVSALAAAMQRSGTSPQDIANLIFTSCSAPLVPALDVPVMQQLQFPPTVARVPMYQHGCVGGAVGLSLANKLVAASNKPAAVVSVELCSLIHQGSDLSRASFAGSAIFGDGAGCAIVSPDSGLLRFVASTSFLVPDTAHLIGYHIRDDGTHLMLEKEVALSLIDAVPGVVAEFLDQQQIATTDIDAWLLHPGSAKIIESLQSALAIDSEKCRWSWEILTEQGNMSSASLFFVLERFLRDLAQTTRNQAPFKRALMLGVGPGVALELILFENVV